MSANFSIWLVDHSVILELQLDQWLEIQLEVQTPTSLDNYSNHFGV